MSILLSLALIPYFFVLGDGLLHWAWPASSAGRFQRLVLGAVSGLVALTLALNNLYFLSLRWTAADLAWPVSLALAGVTLWRWRRPRPAQSLQRNPLSLATLLLPTLAVLLYGAPLLGHASLAYYYSNNGEFAVYASIADVMQHHPYGTTLPGLVPLATREGATSIVAAAIAALFRCSSLWTVQPLALAAAWLSMSLFGLLLGLVAGLKAPSTLTSACLAALLGWACFSSAYQQFWTLSFLSQYLSFPAFFAVLYLRLRSSAEAPRPGLASQAWVYGFILAYLACIYTQFTFLFIALFGLLFLASSEGGGRQAIANILTLFALIVGVAFLACNALGFWLLTLPTVGTYPLWRSGWNLYGEHDDLLAMLARLHGFSNYFAGPSSPQHLPALLLAGALLLGLLYGLVSLRRERQPGARGLFALQTGFYAILAALCYQIYRHGYGINYNAVKFYLAFAWVPLLGLGILFQRLPQSRWRWAAAFLVAFLSLAQVRSAYRFNRYLITDAQAATFDEAAARACRTALGPDAKVTISSAFLPLRIVGSFLAYDKDILPHWRQWQAEMYRPPSGAKTVLLVGQTSKIETDKKIKGPYAITWQGPCVKILQSVPRP